jgi:hypothetical protein
VLSTADVSGLGSAATASTSAFDAAGSAASVLPVQTGNSGKYLSTTGTAATWATLPTAPVTSVAGRTGAITLAESDVANLTSDLASKLSLTGGSLTGNLSVSGSITAGSYAGLPVVTTSANGLMLAADKLKLNTYPATYSAPAVPTIDSVLAAGSTSSRTLTLTAGANSVELTGDSIYVNGNDLYLGGGFVYGGAGSLLNIGILDFGNGGSIAPYDSTGVLIYDTNGNAYTFANGTVQSPRILMAKSISAVVDHIPIRVPATLTI